jgi:hypothetical protein
MHDRDDDPRARFEAEHAAIIGRTLRWADAAAARRDYAEAIRWVETVRALGQGLPDEYKTKHASWVNAIDRERRTERG